MELKQCHSCGIFGGHLMASVIGAICPRCYDICDIYYKQKISTEEEFIGKVVLHNLPWDKEQIIATVKAVLSAINKKKGDEMIKGKGDVTVGFLKMIHEQLIEQGYKDDSKLDVLLDIPGIDTLISPSKIEIKGNRDTTKPGAIIITASQKQIEAYIAITELEEAVTKH